MSVLQDLMAVFIRKKETAFSRNFPFVQQYPSHLARASSRNLLHMNNILIKKKKGNEGGPFMHARDNKRF